MTVRHGEGKVVEGSEIRGEKQMQESSPSGRSEH